jgi:hypothetical protein
MMALAGVTLLAVGCGRIFRDRLPEGSAPAELKHLTFDIVARDNRCEPAVLAADREGRAILITFQVTSAGKSHIFQIPDLDVRMRIPEGTQVAIPVVADRAGIYAYACNSVPWIGLLTAAGKLAIK